MTESIKTDGKFTVPAQYEKLFNIDSAMLKEISKKSIDLIFLDFVAAEGRLRVENKKIIFETRTIGQDKQEDKINEKLKEYDRYGAVAFPALTSSLSIGAALFGQGAVSGLMNAAANAANQAGSHMDKQSEGRKEFLSHRTQLEGQLIQEYNNSLREEDQSFERALSTLDRVHQAQQRAIEGLNSAG
ncbi:MAG: hypothetical protein LW832_08610 [Parachlamydia sp.]|jgi:hypothetical protein|nr:hypothetical protein [Parachlamydia sp.]